MVCEATRQIEDTKTFQQLKRLGAVTFGNNTRKLNTNVGENWFNPSFGEDGEIVLWDGQISCWGADDEIAALLSDLEEGSDFEDLWHALASLPNNS